MQSSRDGYTWNKLRGVFLDPVDLVAFEEILEAVTWSVNTFTRSSSWFPIVVDGLYFVGGS